MMSNIQEIEINIHRDLIKYINWLKEYKSRADEALSILVELDVPDELKHAQELALRAMNFSAHTNLESET